MKVTARHSRAETSTRSPTPECRRAVKALTAPSAPNVPRVHSASPPPTARGSRWSLPWLWREPDRAWRRRSEEPSPPRGPLSPKAERLRATSRGWRSARPRASTPQARRPSRSDHHALLRRGQEPEEGAVLVPVAPHRPRGRPAPEAMALRRLDLDHAGPG